MCIMIFNYILFNIITVASFIIIVCLFGCLCLAVSIRFAHGSLMYKLKARKQKSTLLYSRQEPSDNGAPVFHTGMNYIIKEHNQCFIHH